MKEKDESQLFEIEPLVSRFASLETKATVETLI